MMILFRRKPYVTILKDVTRLRGNDIEIAHMMAACMLALEERGWDITDVRKAVRDMKLLEMKEE